MPTFSSAHRSFAEFSRKSLERDGATPSEPLRGGAIVAAEQERLGGGKRPLRGRYDEGVLVMRILMLVAAMSCSALVLADSAVAMKMKPATSFGYLDTDKDARVSPAEAKADWAVAQGFVAADINKDGYLDKMEFAALSRG
jgi:hypothetical protein